MKTASITEAKNRRSALLDEVRHGHAVLITDRGRPVARIEPAAGSEAEGDDDRLARLERNGLIARARRPKSTLGPLTPVRAAKGASIVAALLEERAESR